MQHLKNHNPMNLLSKKDKTQRIDVWWSDSDLSDSYRQSLDCKTISELKILMRILFNNGKRQLIGYVRYSYEGAPKIDYLFNKNGVLLKEVFYDN